MGFLAGIGGLVMLVCLILTLVKMYPIEGVGKTILGFFCGLFAFVWGWQHSSKDPAHKNVMIAWSVGLLVYVIGFVGLSRG